MKFIKKLFTRRELTPIQFYFPYFFNEVRFENIISKYGFTTKTKFDSKINWPSVLKLIRNDKEELTIEFGNQFLIDKNGNLILWNTDQDLVTIKKFQLSKNIKQSKNNSVQIDLSRLNIGENTNENHLNLNYFVTFVRKSNLEYDLDHYDNFVILIVNNNQIQIIPFDWFNEKGGDYGYVWPAVAQIDVKNWRLFGTGMRMDNFEIKLEKSL